EGALHRLLEQVAGVVGVDELNAVVGAHRLGGRACDDGLARADVDLDAALPEEAADPADDALALAHDDGVDTHFVDDLRQHVLEGRAAVAADLGFLRCVHAVTIPVVSTRMPGAISLYEITGSCGNECSTRRRRWRLMRAEQSRTG